MAKHKSIKPDQIEERGLGADLVVAVVSGGAGGVAGAAATQAIGKLTGADKPKDEPKK